MWLTPVSFCWIISQTLKAIGKRSQVQGLGFQIEGISNNSDLIRNWHRIYLAISAYSRANSVAGSDECGLTDGISIFRPKPLNL